jgi:hypothetical protein
MEASMKTEDRRLRIEDGGNKEKAPPLGAALCRVLLTWTRRGKAPSRRTFPAQSMTGWAILERGRDLARLGGNRSPIPTWYLAFQNKNNFWGVVSGRLARGFGLESQKPSHKSPWRQWEKEDGNMKKEKQGNRETETADLWAGNFVVRRSQVLPERHPLPAQISGRAIHGYL